MPRMDCLLALNLLLGLWSTAAAACPFCPPSGPTCTEQLSQADVAVLVKWSRVIERTGELEPQTVFSVVEVLKESKSSVKPLQKGDSITVDFLREGKPGDLFVLTAQETNGIPEWGPTWEVSEVSYQYVRQAPSLDLSAVERLPYFLKFLEVSDPFISNDAFAEFSAAQYKDVAQLAPKLSREKIRQWLGDNEPAKQIRHGFYGLLLGMCGNEDDAAYLASRVLPPPATDQPRIGIDGLMAGYVLLTGERGLKQLVDAKLRVPDRNDGEVSAVAATLRFFGDLAPDRVPRSQLLTAMRLLVDDPKHGELAIVDLARWKDWDSAPQIIAAYGKPPFEKDGKPKVLRYALVALKDLAKDPQSRIAVQVREFLDRVRRDEPALLDFTEREMNPPRRSTDAPSRNLLEGNLDVRPAGGPGRNP